MIVTQQENKKIYSDGTETERAMLDIARKYPEKSDDTKQRGIFNMRHDWE